MAIFCADALWAGFKGAIELGLRLFLYVFLATLALLLLTDGKILDWMERLVS